MLLLDYVSACRSLRVYYSIMMMIQAFPRSEEKLVGDEICSTHQRNPGLKNRCVLLIKPEAS
jgi:hypothetical protein